MSCNRISPDLQDELNMQVAELSTFLNDNYTIGDSVYFQNWPSNQQGPVTRGFVVTENYTKEFSKTIVGGDDAEGLFSHQDGYKLVVVLQGAEDKLTVELTCGIENERLLYSCGTFLINNMKDDGYNGLSSERDDPDIIRPRSEKASCTLQRNVGIIAWWNFDKKMTSVEYGEWRLLEK